MVDHTYNPSTQETLGKGILKQSQPERDNQRKELESERDKQTNMTSLGRYQSYQNTKTREALAKGDGEGLMGFTLGKKSVLGMGSGDGEWVCYY